MRCKETSQPFNRSAAYSAKSRSRKKLLAKSNWFKQGGKGGDDRPEVGQPRYSGSNGWKKTSEKEIIPAGWKPRNSYNKDFRAKIHISTVFFLLNSVIFNTFSCSSF